MKKITPYEKLQKKKQRELAAKKRGSWGGINPVTRKPANPKAYNRKKAGRWRDDSPNGLLFLCTLIVSAFFINEAAPFRMLDLRPAFKTGLVQKQFKHPLNSFVSYY